MPYLILLSFVLLLFWVSFVFIREKANTQRDDLMRKIDSINDKLDKITEKLDRR